MGFCPVVYLPPSLFFRLPQAASCSSDKALTFTWTVTCTNDDSVGAAKTRAESSSGFGQTSSKSALKIDAGALVGGKEYEFTVVVALKASSSTATTVTTTVNVEWSPLEPSIVGGQYIVPSLSQPRTQGHLYAVCRM